MLREINRVRQSEQDQLDGQLKRWFTSQQIDLFVWQRGADITAFQMTYDKHAEEQAVTWKKGRGLRQFSVDDGWEPGNYPRSPLMIESNTVSADNLAEVARKLKSESDDIQFGVVEFVCQTLVHAEKVGEQ